ncbi:hypothetical protein [Petrocella sp. FN5]|uniref:hypothetical protein n=1 Tax=Petrocella sp. FN5 TaxID=3032002 RepID=UPI0023DA70F2|nr:hypothetical protein [Petrocella sp. FN5]MDF1617062.1 hypothetical protein [Petrocella sp. FN5]
MTWKTMSKSEKIDHVWAYYKVHILLSIAVILILGSLVNNYWLNPAPDIVMDITIRTKSHDVVYARQLEDTLNHQIMNTAENEALMIEFLEINPEINPTTTMTSEARFMGKSSVKALDILVVDEENKEYLVENKFFISLEEMRDVSEGADLVERLEVLGAKGIDGKFIVSLDYFPRLRPLIQEEDETYYVGVYALSSHKEDIIRVLNYLIEE